MLCHIACTGEATRKLNGDLPVGGNPINLRAPGKGSPNTRATLSKASPAASSNVIPSGRISVATSATSRRLV